MSRRPPTLWRDLTGIQKISNVAGGVLGGVVILAVLALLVKGALVAFLWAWHAM